MENCLNRQSNSSAFLRDHHLKYNENRIKREDSCRAGRAKKTQNLGEFQLDELISVVNNLVWILKTVKMPLTSPF